MACQDRPAWGIAFGHCRLFAKDSRTVYRIGVNFSDELWNIQEVKVEAR